MRHLVPFLLLALLTTSCGVMEVLTGGSSTEPVEPPSESTYEIVIQFLRIIPQSIDAISGLIGAIVIGMVILSCFFRTTRRAMSLFIVAIFGAMTQRVREWRDRQRPKDLLPPEEPEVDKDLDAVEKDSVKG